MNEGHLGKQEIFLQRITNLVYRNLGIKLNIHGFSHHTQTNDGALRTHPKDIFAA